MKYAYPAIFTPAAEGGYDVKVPDLPGCRTCGDDLADAIFMAEDAISMWLWAAENKNEVIPAATVLQSVEAPRFINYVYADTDAYRKKNDARAVLAEHHGGGGRRQLLPNPPGSPKSPPGRPIVPLREPPHPGGSRLRPATSAQCICEHRRRNLFR